MAAGEGGFIEELRSRARARERTLVFPEGTEPRVHAALRDVLPNRLFKCVLLGPPDVVRQGLVESGVDPGDVTLLDPSEPDRVGRYGEVLYGLRGPRGLPEVEAHALAADSLMQAALMVREGEASGSVAGSVRTTGDVVVAALWGVGAADGIQTVSSSFYMVLDADHPRGPAVLTFTDAGVVPHPTPRELAEIAAAAARARRLIVGDEPRVAFLSYSTKGSAEGPSIEAVREALERFRELMPGVDADGELQGDTALVSAVGARKAPDSTVAGRANVLVFPDLNAANIAYKLVQHLGEAQALGPILQGLSKPCSDLSRGASAEDIVSVACITALLAEDP
jgi:phosphate acetyltransferase